MRKRPWKFWRDLTTAWPFVLDLAHRAPGPHVVSGAWELTFLSVKHAEPFVNNYSCIILETMNEIIIIDSDFWWIFQISARCICPLRSKESRFPGAALSWFAKTKNKNTKTGLSHFGGRRVIKYSAGSRPNYPTKWLQQNSHFKLMSKLTKNKL